MWRAPAGPLLWVMLSVLRCDPQAGAPAGGSIAIDAQDTNRVEHTQAYQEAAG